MHTVSLSDSSGIFCSTILHFPINFSSTIYTLLATDAGSDSVGFGANGRKQSQCKLYIRNFTNSRHSSYESYSIILGFLITVVR